jgi:hypothetical protein
VTGGWRKVHNERYNFYSSPSIIKVKEDAMGGPYSTYGREDECVQCFGEKAKGKTHVDRITLNWILEK